MRAVSMKAQERALLLVGSQQPETGGDFKSGGSRRAEALCGTARNSSLAATASVSVHTTSGMTTPLSDRKQWFTTIGKPSSAYHLGFVECLENAAASLKKPGWQVVSVSISRTFWRHGRSSFRTLRLRRTRHSPNTLVTLLSNQNGVLEDCSGRPTRQCALLRVHCAVHRNRCHDCRDEGDHWSVRSIRKAPYHSRRPTRTGAAASRSAPLCAPEELAFSRSGTLVVWFTREAL